MGAGCGTIGPMPNLTVPILTSPIIRRVAWHLRRVGGQLDRRFFITLGEGILGIVAIAAILITLLEKPRTIESLFDSFNWGIADGPRSGQRRFRDLARRAGGRLVAHPVRGRHARDDHRRARRAWSSTSCSRRARVWVRPGSQDHIIVCGWNSDRPRPDRRAARRRLQAEGRRPRRPRQEPGRLGRLLRARRRDERGRPRAGRHRARPRPRSSSRSTAPTRPTCTRS